MGNHTQYLQFCDRELFYLPYAAQILKEFDFHATTDEFSMAELRSELEACATETEKNQYLLNELKKMEEVVKEKIIRVKKSAISKTFEVLNDDKSVNSIVAGSAANNKRENPKNPKIVAKIKNCVENLKNVQKKDRENQILREMVQTVETAMDRYKYQTNLRSERFVKKKS